MCTPRRPLSLFSARSCTAPDLVFKALSHSLLLFVSCVRRGSSVVLLHMNVPFPQHFIESAFLSPLNTLGCLVRRQLAIRAYVSSWALSSAPLACVTAFTPMPCCLITTGLQCGIKSGSVVALALFHFLRLFLAVQDLLWLYTNFKSYFSYLWSPVTGPFQDLQSDRVWWAYLQGRPDHGQEALEPVRGPLRVCSQDQGLYA